MLEEPRPHDVGGHLGEDAPLLVVFLLLLRVVVVPRARRGHAVVQPVSCHMTAKQEETAAIRLTVCLLPALAAPLQSKGINAIWWGILGGLCMQRRRGAERQQWREENGGKKKSTS